MKLVVIMPALNEEATVAEVVARIPRRIPGLDAVEVIVVDDGSTDRTAELARAAGAEVVCHRVNRGVGAAFASGLDAALRRGAHVIVNMDSDGQFNPDDIPELIRPILEGGYGFVTCTRFGKPEFVPRMPRLKRWGNRMMARLVNWIIWGARFTDVSCGFRAYSRDTALRLNLFGRFTYTQETFIALAAHDVAMTEVPLRVRGVRESGESRVARSLWTYGRRAFTIIVRAMRDTRPLKFFGSVGLLTVFLGALADGFVFVRWCVTGRTHPFASLLVVGSAFLMMGFLLCVMALLADMVGRLRKTLEDVRYHLRKAEYDACRHNGSASPPPPGDKGR